MLVDATCAPSNIKYPQDADLLNEARENLKKIIEILHDPADVRKPRTYPKQVRKAYLAIARKRKRSVKEIRKQLKYIRRDLGYIDQMLLQGEILPQHWNERLQTIRQLYVQHKIHKVSDRIVNSASPIYDQLYVVRPKRP